MKKLILMMLVLGSLNAFSAVGENRHPVGEAVMCQTELDELSSTTESPEDKGTEAVDG